MNSPIVIRNLRDIRAIESVPLGERFDTPNTYEILRRSAQRFGEAPALVFVPQGLADERAFSVSFNQLFSRATQAANLFHRTGIGANDVVAFVLPNLPQTHYTIWGAEAAGTVAAVNPLLDPEQIAEILIAVDARALVTLAPDPAGPGLWDKVRAVLDRLPRLHTVLQVDPAQYLVPEWKPAPPRESAIGRVALLDLDLEMAREPADRLVSGRVIRADDIASMFHTGGTTGAPKIAPHTHANEVFMAWSLSAFVDMKPGRTFLCGLPLFHVNAVLVTGLAEFMAGARVLLAGIQGYRSPKLLPNFWKLIERYRVNYFSAVPTIYGALLDVPVAGADVSSLGYAICGAAPMPPEVFRRFEALTGVKILEGYGMTEGTCASVLNPPAGERRIGAIGLPMPYQQVKVAMIGEEGSIRRDAAPGEIGVVVMRGPQVFPGYLRESDNRSAWAIDTGGERWLNTGDLARVDEDGYLWLAGRAKDLIIRGGHNIDPQMIEEAVCRHPAVQLAAAVGQPDAHAGEVPMCFVVLREGARASEAELLEFARGAVPERAAAPVRIEIIPNLPITAVGKIFKPALRYRAIEHVIGRTLRDAGIDASVSAGPDAKHGTAVAIALADAGREAAAREFLGRFALRFEFGGSRK